ncbi:MAG: family efflux transporter subunit, HlyD family secretion protein, partial [Parcubacteria group bacterium]|nr:family efflux transporter subunit, HlyD family secretion protein [Parcubacteria group bacterium]
QAKEQAYNDHFVIAPFDGVIAQVSGNVGSQASGSTGIATLITTQELADITLNEVDVASVKVGQTADLTFDAITGLSITGTVAEVDGIGTVSSGVVSYAVKIALGTQDARVKPGMTVNADIQTANATGVIVIPSSAIKTANGRSFVQIFDPALPSPANPQAAAAGITSTQTPKRVSVQTGITDGTKTEITSGLTPGQQILVRTITGTATGTTAAKSTAAAATTRTTGGGGGFGGGGGGVPRGL